MVTPMTDARAIDWQSLDHLVEWYVDAGVDGLFPVSLSSEMYDLSDDERIATAERVVAAADGRVPVIATGTFGRPLDDEAAFVRRMAETGVDAVVVNVAEMAEEDATAADWQAQVEALLERTDDVPLGLYECPVPYHRLLSDDSLQMVAASDRFVFCKDTCCDGDRLAERATITAGTPLGLYNANAPLLLDSLRAGADGYCGIAANFYPGLLAWLCAHYDDDPATAEELSRFLSVADYLVREAYPAAAKRYLARTGVIETATYRGDAYSPPEDHLQALDALAASVDDWRGRLGIDG